MNQKPDNMDQALDMLKLAVHSQEIIFGQTIQEVLVLVVEQKWFPNKEAQVNDIEHLLWSYFEH